MARARGCLVWKVAPIGLELDVAAESAPGTSCMQVEFRRFSSTEARELLAKRTLTILGDSVSTYLYLSLAHFLHSGDALKTWDSKAKGHAHPLFELWWSVIGNGWTTARWWAWNAFYNGTSADFGGNEICDCWRDRCFPACKPQTFFGNRFFRFGNGPHQGRVFMIPWYGRQLRPRWHTLDTDRWRLRCPTDPSTPADDRLCPTGSPPAADLGNASNSSSVLDAIAQEFNPDLMLIGMYSNWPLEKQVASLCRFAANYEPAGSGDDKMRLWMEFNTGSWNFASPSMWRRVNATRPCHLPKRAGSELLMSTVIARLLLHKNRRSVFVDRVHFAPWVYHELNQLLLNSIDAALRARTTSGRQRMRH